MSLLSLVVEGTDMTQTNRERICNDNFSKANALRRGRTGAHHQVWAGKKGQCFWQPWAFPGWNLRGLGSPKDKALGCWKRCKNSVKSLSWRGEGHRVICATLKFWQFILVTAMDHQNKCSSIMGKWGCNRALTQEVASGFRTGSRRRLEGCWWVMKEPGGRGLAHAGRKTLLKAGEAAESWTQSCLQQSGK